MSSGFADIKVALPNLIQDAFEAFFWMNSFKKFNFLRHTGEPIDFNRLNDCFQFTFSRIYHVFD